MAFASKVKAGSMATRATMSLTWHASRRAARFTTMCERRAPVPEQDGTEAETKTELCQAVETRGPHGAEGHPA